MQKSPPHPGSIIWAEILEPRGFNVTTASAVLRMSRQNLSLFLNGRANLTAELAYKFERGFGVQMETLMRYQLDYDAAKLRKHGRTFGIRRQLTAA
jgi:antitoxin HigA-1